jgi:hypothetical protein
MSADYKLPPELVQAAQSLEQQIRDSGVISRTIPLSEWDSLAPKIKNFVPRWLASLLANHKLAEVAFKRPHESQNWERYFYFWLPFAYAKRVTPDDPIASKTNGWWLTKEMIDRGYIPLSDESDGDLWVTPISGDATSPIYLYSLTADCFILAGETIAAFLASCAISDEEHR